MKPLIGIFSLLFLLSTSVHSQEKIDGWLVFNTGNSSLPNNNVRDLKFDRKGYLWVGMWGGALARYNRNDGSWKLYNQINSGVPGSRINQIDIDRRGHIWMVAADGGFARFDGDEEWETVKMPPGVQPQSIAVNRYGVALIGTYKHGLFVYSKEKVLSRIWGEDNKVAYSVTDIDFDGDNHALVCTESGLLRFSVVPGGMYTSIHKSLSDFPVYRVAYDDRNEEIWAIERTDQKVVKRKRNRWKIYRNGPTDLRYARNYGEALDYQASAITVVDSKRYSLTMGTRYLGGVAAYGGMFWGVLKTPYSDARMSGGVEALTTDPRGALWVGTWARGMMVRVGEDIDPTEPEEGLTEEETTQLQLLTTEQKKLLKGKDIVHQDTVRPAAFDVELLIWDSQLVDGDTVSVMLNGVFIAERQVLSKKPMHLKVNLLPKDNRLVLIAHNLGEIPPNTANVAIRYRNVEHEVVLKSDLQSSGAVIMIPTQSALPTKLKEDLEGQ